MKSLAPVLLAILLTTALTGCGDDTAPAVPSAPMVPSAPITPSPPPMPAVPDGFTPGQIMVVLSDAGTVACVEQAHLVEILENPLTAMLPERVASEACGSLAPGDTAEYLASEVVEIPGGGPVTLFQIRGEVLTGVSETSMGRRKAGDWWVWDCSFLEDTICTE